LKKVLIISYYFPPSGGPGVQRVLKFVKYLPEFGWQPVVLTVEDGDFPARDESLLKEVPEDIKVYRTKIFEPYGIYRKLTRRQKGTALDVDNINKGSKESKSEKIAEFIRATFFIPDARRGWLRYAVSEGKKIIDREKPELIFSSSPPYTCALIGMYLKRYSGLPWVSDFRDAWTGYLTSPKRWFIPSAIDKSYEKKTLKDADAVTIVAQGFKEDFEKKYPDAAKNKRFELVRNGFDGEDFADVKTEQIDKDAAFTVVYTGSMYGKRNPFFFLDTVNELVEDGLADRNKIKFIFVGRLGSEIQNYIDKNPLKDRIERISYVTHNESIKYLLKADAMLLLIDEDVYSKWILSGKVFEYLGAASVTGKPVIAIAPEGEAKAVIEETKSGIVVGHHDKEQLADLYLRLYKDKLNNEFSFQPDKKAIAEYDRKKLTAKLAGIFDSLIN
jgi:glycosyltransferase involved in cell wall biosynthesis